MNKRFCKVGQFAAKAFFLFAVCGATYSCKDDYYFDDSNPSWLGSSIYEYLESQGNYTNFVKLINDLDYHEVLARTGSKTLFVANDDAFNTFYQNNAWGVHSYDELTLSQKKLLLNNAMINNAYLLEMMSSTAAAKATDDNPNPSPVKGECLRRETAADVTDSVPHLFGDDLPRTYSATDKDYWARFRDKGIYLAMDATSPMMTHFLATQMAQHNITDNDFTIITGQTRTTKDAFIYDSRVIEQDITCQNGYINCLDKVLLNPQNMAEVLRTNGRTNIFSHMLDRFSAPFYNETLTNRYRLLYGNSVDSVFQKRYFSNRSVGGASNLRDQLTDPTAILDANHTVNYALTFDPGWNTYFPTGVAVQRDMGTIFAPTDEKLMDYFFSDNGGGRFLIKAYAPDMLSVVTPQTTDKAKVYEAIDQIPLDVIQELLNNLMKESFNNSVPSKFETIKNDASDPMFDETDDYHRSRILGTLLANNGVIYLMDEVTTPATYAAVSAPALVEQDKRIFNWAITQRQLNGIYVDYYAFLKAMSSRFSFFVPSDKNGNEDFVYVDPLSFYNPDNQTVPGSLIGRAFKYTWNASTSKFDANAYTYTYNLADHTGIIGDSRLANEKPTGAAENRLKDMLETHTIVHEDNTETSGIDETQTGAECNKHYFLSKNGAVVYINNATSRANGMTVQGGMQLENGDYSRVTSFDDKSAQSNGYGNGFAYTINTPLLPTIESVYSVLYNNSDFEEFFKLCEVDADVLAVLFSESERSKYNIFVDNGGLPCFDKNSGDKVTSATNVRFFSNYRYTLYVPTNDAITTAINTKELPTWSSIRDYLGLNEEGELPEGTTLTDNQKKAAQSMVTLLINFVKYHFQDNSVFADTYTTPFTTYETGTMKKVSTGDGESDDGPQIYCKLKVSSTGNGLTVTDESGKTVSTTSNKNIVARDYLTNKGETAAETTLTASSAIVIHGIDNVLDFRTYKDDKYSSVWTSSSEARKFLKEYQILF